MIFQCILPYNLFYYKNCFHRNAGHKVHLNILQLKNHRISVSYNILLPFRYTAEMYHAIFHLLYINDTPFKCSPFYVIAAGRFLKDFSGKTLSTSRVILSISFTFSERKEIFSSSVIFLPLVTNVFHILTYF